MYARLAWLVGAAPTRRRHVTFANAKRQRTTTTWPSAPRIALIAAVVVLAGACSSTTPVVPPTSAPPVVTIDPGITPRMTPEQVESTVIAQIHAMEAMVGYVVRPARILTVTATAGIRWRVQAEGTFTSNRPRGSPAVAATGYFVLNDADGGVIEFGYP
jgi:hypothetical protein